MVSVVLPLRKSHHAGTNSRYANFSSPSVSVQCIIHTSLYRVFPGYRIVLDTRISAPVWSCYSYWWVLIWILFTFALLCLLDTLLSVCSHPQCHFATCCCITVRGRRPRVLLRVFHWMLMWVMSTSVLSAPACGRLCGSVVLCMYVYVRFRRPEERCGCLAFQGPMSETFSFVSDGSAASGRSCLVMKKWRDTKDGWGETYGNKKVWNKDIFLKASHSASTEDEFVIFIQ